MVTALESLLLINVQFVYFTNQERTEIQHKLSTSTSDRHRRELEQQLTDVEKRIRKRAEEVQRYKELIQYDEREIAEIRGGAEERQRKEGE